MRPTLTVLLVMALSSAAAFLITAGQEKALGEQPFVMILFGWCLAFILGLARRRYPALCGKRTSSIVFLAASAATMSGFFIAAILDLYLHDGRGHSMLPLEFAFYAIYTCTGLIVATSTSNFCKDW